MRRAAWLALVLAGLLSGCRAYNSSNPYPSDRTSGVDGGFPITKSFLNNAVERGRPNLE